MAVRSAPLLRRCCDDACMSTVAHTRFDEPRVAERASAFGALGDEVRLKMIKLLAQHESLCVCELQQAFDLEQPTISHHLRVLREANLVEVRRVGTWAYYSLRKDAVKHLVQELVVLI